jgi:hypothetical protein
MLLERPGAKALKESTRIPREAPDAFSRKQQRQSAEEIYRARMTELARGRHALPSLTAPAAPITFSAFADWYAVNKIPKHRGAEREQYALLPLRAFFGALPLTAITNATVDEYETARLAKVKPRTVNREVALLKMILAAAVPTHLPTSPLLRRRLLRVVKPPKRVLTPAEELRLLEELPDRDRVLYIVAVDTLARLSNVINLRRDENKGTYLALTDSKTGPYRVPLSTRAKQALASLPQDGPYYFPHRRHANIRDTRGAVRRMLERACKRAKIPYGRAAGGVTFHTATRATGATRMLRQHVDPATVQAIGNWKDFRAMQEYLEPDAAHMTRAVNLIAPITPASRKARNTTKSGAKS